MGTARCLSQIKIYIFMTNDCFLDFYCKVTDLVAYWVWGNRKRGKSKKRWISRHSPMVDAGGHPLHAARRPLWGRTLLAQALLCAALYVAFNIGRPQRHPVVGEPMDLYFLSVRGGEWPLEPQKQLLQQMEKAVKKHKARFVVNIGDLGDADPLMHNATLNFPLLKIPWYSKAALRGQATSNFLKSIKIPRDQILEIVGFDTAPFKDFLPEGKLSDAGKGQLDWIQTTLAATDSRWRIVVGFDPLIACEEDQAKGITKFYEPLHRIFLEYGVNAYLSQQGCAGYLHNAGGFVYIGHPGPANDKYMTNRINGSSEVLSEMDNGFFLHRVSPLEIESYLIDSEGKVVLNYIIQQHGRGEI